MKEKEQKKKVASPYIQINLLSPPLIIMDKSLDTFSSEEIRETQDIYSSSLLFPYNYACPWRRRLQVHRIRKS